MGSTIFFIKTLPQTISENILTKNSTMFGELIILISKLSKERNKRFKAH